MFTVPRILLLISLFLLSACSQKNASNIAAESSFKVALLTPGSISDGGWNQIAYEGLQQIKKECNAQIGYQETRNASAMDEAFNAFASQGYNLIFGHGFEFQEPLRDIAPAYPNTLFVITWGTTVQGNISSMICHGEEITYLFGMLSALMSTTGKAGLIGGIDIPPIRSSFAAFERGAKSVNPKFAVLRTVIGNFDDVAAAKEATLQLINAGASHVYHNADHAGLGMIQAAKEREIYAFGMSTDQSEVAPDVVLASCVVHLSEAFVQIAKDVQSKTFKPGVQVLGMKQRIVDLVFNEKLKAKISPETMQKINDTKQKIINGELKIPILGFENQ